VKPTLLLIACLAGLIAGCAEHKDYYFKDFNVSREQAYDAVMYVLRDEGYDVTEFSENMVNDLPEAYMETDWNMRQTGNPYAGNDVRRKAYIKLTTQYSDRTPVEYQPLSEEDGEALTKLKDDIRKKADLETTRISVAVRSERRTDIKRPLEADWIYEGPDKYEVMALLGRVEAIFGKQSGRAGRPSAKGEKLKEEQIRAGSGN
jgi:hypothetical protein